MSNDPELTPSQLSAITLLAEGKSIVATAKKIEISDRTIYRWLKISTFSDELRKVVTNNYKVQLHQLQGLLGKGIDRLNQLLIDPTTPPTDIIRTVKLLVEAGDRFQQLSALEEIEKIKALLESK